MMGQALHSPHLVTTLRRKASVTLVNLNLVRIPAIAPYALDVLGTALEDAGHGVTVLDLTRAEDPMAAIAAHFASGPPDLVALSMRNNFDVYFPSYGKDESDGSFVPSHARVIAAIRAFVPPERIVIGGVGFSTAPFGFLERFDLRYGVRGPGDALIARLADARAAGTELDAVAWPREVRGRRVLFEGRGSSLVRRVRRTFVDNRWYYEYGGLGAVRSTNGCAMRCSYCVEPYAKGKRYGRGAVDDVLHEIDQLVAMGIYDVQTADSEFNMPFQHAKSLLRGLLDRGHRNLRLWVYGQPKPWDEEFTELLAKVGVPGVNIGTDHTDPEMLRTIGKWYSPEDVVRMSELCNANGIAVMHELLHGAPGDTPEKMFRAIDFLRALEPRVIGVTIGLGVLEGTPLGDLLVARLGTGDRAGFHFRGEPFVDPVYYVDPSFVIPRVYEDLARFVGTDIDRIMIPRAASAGDTDNQLVNSSRIEDLVVKRQKKGAYWYHYAGG